MTPDERARRAADAMWENDAASAWFGMRITDVGEGRATLELTVAAHHCNGLGSCHGGVIFALADSAFAFACNSRNQATVAQQNTVTYLAPAKPGDTLTASAVERALSGRSGVYDATVVKQDGTTIAEFRGLSRTIPGHHFEETSG
jgi:acyl-CoA thioesterase